MRLFAAFLFAILPLPAEADWAGEVIYFVMVDRFADGDPANNMDVDLDNPLAFQGGDLVGLRENLDEIADLGATAIWLTPINQQVTHTVPAEGRDFFPHHGYWANDFNAIDPRYGDEATLSALVDRAHQLGLKVILDVVYNHVGYGADWTATRPEWVRRGADCGGDDITMCLSGLPDLRTELPELRDLLFEAHIGLAERTGLDGFRLDTVKHIDHDFWAAHRDEVRLRLGEDFLLLGEVWDADKYLAEPYFETGEMDALFDFGFRNRTLKFLQGIEKADRYARYFAKRHDVRDGFLLSHFLSNHDMPMMLALLKGDASRLQLGLVLMMTSEGLPVLSWGEEVGRRGGVWPNNREVMPWGARNVVPGQGSARDEALRDDVKALINLRKNYPELSGDQIEILHAEGGQLAYLRGDTFLVIINRDGGDLGFDFPAGHWDTIWSHGETAFAPASAMIYHRQDP